MRLIDESPFESHLFRTALSDEVMVGTLVTKATYAMLDGGTLALHSKQHRVLPGGAKVGGVDFPPDAGYGKVGVDVLALANAYAPGGRPAAAMMAGVSIDDSHLAVAVIGDRRWEKRWSGHVASHPEPFAVMPITWAQAYGGHARVRGTEVPYVDNPLGKGYLLQEAEAEDAELPNIENPAELIRRPMDQPRPVSFCPLPIGTSYMADALEEVDEDGGGLSKEIYNVAVPAHRLPRYVPGAVLRLHNLTPTPVADCRLPSLDLIAEVIIGSARYEFVGEVDTILVLPETRELVLTHRVVFRYDYARTVSRVVRLRYGARMSQREQARL